jgi:DNA-binding response OmpR family regulator
MYQRESKSANPPQSSEIATAAKFLIVDAELQTRASIAQSLRHFGHRVDEANCGQEALQLLEQTAYDVMILDLAISDMNGVEVMHRARLMRRDLAILIVTSLATVESTMAAVKANVADYILKPCNMDDLQLTVARVLEERVQQLRHARLLEMVSEVMGVLHQPEPVAEPMIFPALATSPLQAQDMIRMGILTLDRQKRLVTLKTDPPRTVELTESEMSILLALMEKPNQVISCNQLANKALGYTDMDRWTIENVIRSCVFRLRHKIEGGSDAPRLIRTVRGRGYFFSLA